MGFCCPDDQLQYIYISWCFMCSKILLWKLHIMIYYHLAIIVLFLKKVMHCHISLHMGMILGVFAIFTLKTDFKNKLNYTFGISYKLNYRAIVQWGDKEHLLSLAQSRCLVSRETWRIHDKWSKKFNSLSWIKIPITVRRNSRKECLKLRQMIMINFWH